MGHPHRVPDRRRVRRGSDGARRGQRPDRQLRADVVVPDRFVPAWGGAGFLLSADDAARIGRRAGPALHVRRACDGRPATTLRELVEEFIYLCRTTMTCFPSPRTGADRLCEHAREVKGSVPRPMGSAHRSGIAKSMFAGEYDRSGSRCREGARPHAADRQWSANGDATGTARRHPSAQGPAALPLAKDRPKRMWIRAGRARSVSPSGRSIGGPGDGQLNDRYPAVS